MIHRIHLPETTSTNTIARQELPHCPSPLLLVTAEHQTAGRGQRGNTWEAAPGKNLLFTLALRPSAVKAAEQFVLCELISVALCEVLGSYATDIHIKWPNDIYYRDHKLCGILIEHDICGTHLAHTLIGVGLNVNQELFVGDAPNPISLRQILGHEVDREALLAAIITKFTGLYPSFSDAPGVAEWREAMHTRYTSLLYRLGTPALYSDAGGRFSATLRDVELDGRLHLEDEQGTLRSYLFKEVAYIIQGSSLSDMRTHSSRSPFSNSSAMMSFDPSEPDASCPPVKRNLMV